jgi:hypothetical protein
MHWLVAYADLISAVFGLLGSVILALPLLKEITDRRHWQRLIRFLAREHSSGPSIQKTQAEIDAERELREDLINTRLGDYDNYRFAALFGFSFLFVAFLFAAIAAVDRAVNVH